MEEGVPENKKEFVICARIILVEVCVVALVSIMFFIIAGIQGYLSVGNMLLGVFCLILVCLLKIGMGLFLLDRMPYKREIFILFEVISYLFAFGMSAVFLLTAEITIFFGKYITALFVTSLFLLPIIFCLVMWNGSVGILLHLKREYVVKEPENEAIIFRKDFEPTGEIQGLFGDYFQKSHQIFAQELCYIGRSHECAVQIKHKKVSRVHCCVKRPDYEQGYLVTDYSSNGTYYENKKLQYGVEYELPPKAILVIGDADNVLQLM